MLALYRSGRQAEALTAYQDGRRRLVDDLGIEPSRALRDLEKAILRHDPALEPAPAEVTPGAVETIRAAVAPAAALAEDRGAFVGRADEVERLRCAVGDARCRARETRAAGGGAGDREDADSARACCERARPRRAGALGTVRRA